VQQPRRKNDTKKDLAAQDFFCGISISNEHLLNQSRIFIFEMSNRDEKNDKADMFNSCLVNLNEFIIRRKDVLLTGLY